MTESNWRRRELAFLIVYAVAFYAFVIRRSLQLSHDYYTKLYGLRPGWIANRLNDASDAQWRNFRGNLQILTVVFGIFTLVANVLRTYCCLRAKGMAYVWLLISLAYLSYLHGACIIFILTIASANFLLVKIFGRTKYFSYLLWTFNLSFLVCNRVYGGYQFSSFGQHWAFLDNFRGTFRWHICFNFVVLRMISYGYDYHWMDQNNRFDQEKHIQRCSTCISGKICYMSLQERSVQNDKFSFAVYLCYLVYAPLYIAGPIISFNAFASQLDTPQKNYSSKQVVWYGFRWILSLFLMELMTHFFYYNAFAISGVWKQLTPMDNFIIGYGVLNFMWLKFFLLWRYFRFWSLVQSVFGEFLLRELNAVAGAVTITCLMVANLVGFVIGPSGINWLISGFLRKEGLPTVGGMLISFYIGTKLMFHISDSQQKRLKKSTM
ncbi:membrane-bound O-acyltransferase gup1 isoform X4 [Coffea arabica]|uniref:Membrane-bound O-acyltransferase gup1 isoform X4 n=1 Tax=Coffea arabica TaxID=13443 RepID=A0ABM4WZC3_COFAR